MVKIEITEAECKTLLAYLPGCIIDAEGNAAIGFRNCRAHANRLKNVIKKLRRVLNDE